MSVSILTSIVRPYCMGWQDFNLGCLIVSHKVTYHYVKLKYVRTRLGVLLFCRYLSKQQYCTCCFVDMSCFIFPSFYLGRHGNLQICVPDVSGQTQVL